MSAKVKTPAAVSCRGFASSTGHVDSPDTIVIQKKRTTRVVTPAKMSKLALYEDLPPTPAPPTVMFVSPLSHEKPVTRRRSVLTRMAQEEKPSPDLVGVKHIMRERKSIAEPNLAGVKEVMKDRRKSKDPSLVGVKELFQAPKSPAESKFTGVKELMNQAKSALESHLVGVKEMLAEVVSPGDMRLAGVRDMMQEPKPRKSVSLTGVRELLHIKK